VASKIQTKFSIEILSMEILPNAGRVNLNFVAKSPTLSFQSSANMLRLSDSAKTLVEALLKEMEKTINEPGDQVSPTDPTF
jgi:predicted transcriptional regulator